MQPTQKSRSLLAIIAAVIVLLIIAVIFGFWAFSGRQDYKNNATQKIAVAVAAAKQQTQAADAKQYAADAAKPLKTYNGPEAFGSIVLSYPKTWSAYVNEQDSSSPAIDAYFQPDFVPSISDTTNNFALRLQVIQQPYDTELSQFTSQSQQQQVTVTPYALPKVPSVIGVRVDGQIAENKQGSMIILPLRNETLELWTESSQYETDFNTNILPNFSFSP